MLYGYGMNQLNEFGLLEMKEITFAASPKVLRQIAFFLSEMAQKMEAGNFSNSSHVHIGDVIRNWNELFPQKDIIVMPLESTNELKGSNGR